MVSEKEIKKFIAEVDSLLPVHSKRERLFLKKLKLSIEDYGNENSFSSLQDIIDNFGEPLDVVRSYVDSMDIDMLMKEISARRILKRIFITVLICAVLGLSIFAGFTYKGYLEYKNTIVTEIETVITDE